MLTADQKKQYLARVLNPSLGYLEKKKLRKQILEKASKNSICPHCRELNGTVKKASQTFLKIVHEKYKKKKLDVIVEQNLAEFQFAIQDNKEIESIIQSAPTVDVLNPLEVNEK